MLLTRLVYASSHFGTTAGAISEILEVSRANNERDGITGALVCSDQDFMQLLEGERSDVAKCLMRIILDSRHRNVHILFANDAEDRLFPDWSMYSTSAARIKKKAMAKHLIDGTFEPTTMPAYTAVKLMENLATKDNLPREGGASSLRLWLRGRSMTVLCNAPPELFLWFTSSRGWRSSTSAEPRSPGDKLRTLKAPPRCRSPVPRREGDQQMPQQDHDDDRKTGKKVIDPKDGTQTDRPRRDRSSDFTTEEDRRSAGGGRESEGDPQAGGEA